MRENDIEVPFVHLLVIGPSLLNICENRKGKGLGLVFLVITGSEK